MWAEYCINICHLEISYDTLAKSTQYRLSITAQTYQSHECNCSSRTFSPLVFLNPFLSLSHKCKIGRCVFCVQISLQDGYVHLWYTHHSMKEIIEIEKKRVCGFAHKPTIACRSFVHLTCVMLIVSALEKDAKFEFL